MKNDRATQKLISSKSIDLKKMKDRISGLASRNYPSNGGIIDKKMTSSYQTIDKLKSTEGRMVEHSGFKKLNKTPEKIHTESAITRPMTQDSSFKRMQLSKDNWLAKPRRLEKKFLGFNARSTVQLQDRTMNSLH
jgi:hypothetical protein